MSVAYSLPPPTGYGLCPSIESMFRRDLRKIAGADRLNIRGIVQKNLSPGMGPKAGNPFSNLAPQSPPASPPRNSRVPATNSGSGQPQSGKVTTPNTTPNTNPNLKKTPYGFANRLSDVWSMLIDRIKLWWYQSRMKSGNMTDAEWRTVQEAATRLGKNQTARSLGAWWNPKQYDADYFDGLSNFTKQLQNVHKLRSYGNTYRDLPAWRLGKYKAAWNAAKLYGDYGKDMDRAMAWGNKYGYVDDELYNTYNQGVKNFR